MFDISLECSKQQDKSYF